MPNELYRTTLLSAIYEHLQLLQVYRSWLRALGEGSFTKDVHRLHGALLASLEVHEAVYRKAFEGRNLGEDLRQFAEAHKRRPESGD